MISTSSPATTATGITHGASSASPGAAVVPSVVTLVAIGESSGEPSAPHSQTPAKGACSTSSTARLVIAGQGKHAANLSEGFGVQGDPSEHRASLVRDEAQPPNDELCETELRNYSLARSFVTHRIAERSAATVALSSGSIPQTILDRYGTPTQRGRASSVRRCGRATCHRSRWRRSLLHRRRRHRRRRHGRRRPRRRRHRRWRPRRRRTRSLTRRKRRRRRRRCWYSRLRRRPDCARRRRRESSVAGLALVAAHANATHSTPLACRRRHTCAAVHEL
jgi:hypothetical protein